MKKVLLTGASGGIGTRLRKLLPPLYPDLVLSDLKAPADLGPDETFVPADLSDFAAIRGAVEGVDGIVHLGGHSVEGPWETILSANIIGTYNLFEAAYQASVKRVVFASSNHAMGFYPRSETIGVDEMVRPDSRYGVSKAFGEAVAAFYAFKHGIGSFCIRIGNVDDCPVDARRLAIWLSPDDLVSLIRTGLETPDLVHDIVYGMSDNARAWWDNSRAKEVGYRPQDRAEDHAAAALAAQAELPPDPVGDVFQGGAFCSAEFTAALDKISGAKR
jgi:uronate dehydrogenase